MLQTICYRPYTPACARARARAHTHTHTDTHTHAHTHTQIHTHTHRYTHTYTHRCTHTHIHTHIHTHTHMRARTHTQSDGQGIRLVRHDTLLKDRHQQTDGCIGVGTQLDNLSWPRSLVDKQVFTGESGGERLHPKQTDKRSLVTPTNDGTKRSRNQLCWTDVDLFVMLQIRGAHIMFCNLDELMTSLLCLLHYIIDEFRNTCDKKNCLTPYNHFHPMRQNVR